MNSTSLLFILILALAAVLLLTGCVRPVAKDVSNNHHKFLWGQIIYSPGGHWYGVGYTPLKGVHRGSFEVLSRYYAKDKNRVWFRSEMLPEADPATFDTLALDYGRDQHHLYLKGFLLRGLNPDLTTILSLRYLRHGDDIVYVYHEDDPHHPHIYMGKMPVSDPERFSVITESWSLSTDEEYLYYRDYRLSGRKNNDFETASLGFGTAPVFINGGALHVVFFAHREENRHPEDLEGYLSVEMVPVGDSGNFHKTYSPVHSVENRGNWAVVNGNLLAYTSYPGMEIIAESGPFRFDEEFPFRFIRDNDTVYYDGGRERGVIRIPDPDGSFEVLNLRFARDSRFVYMFGEILEGADPASFRILERHYEKDANKVYHLGTPIEGADPASFEVFDEESWKQHKRRYHAADKNNFYFGSEVIPK